MHRDDTEGLPHEVRYNPNASNAVMIVPNATSARAKPLALERRAATRVFNMVTPLLDRHLAEGWGERPALRLDGRTVSYRELHELANRAGNALAALGVEPEQRVALLLPDGVEFVATFLGAMKLGAVPVPLNTLAPPADL